MLDLLKTAFAAASPTDVASIHKSAFRLLLEAFDGAQKLEADAADLVSPRSLLYVLVDQKADARESPISLHRTGAETQRGNFQACFPSNSRLGLCCS